MLLLHARVPSLILTPVLSLSWYPYSLLSLAPPCQPACPPYLISLLCRLRHYPVIIQPASFLVTSLLMLRRALPSLTALSPVPSRV